MKKIRINLHINSGSCTLQTNQGVEIYIDDNKNEMVFFDEITNYIKSLDVNINIKEGEKVN
jgi:hypothetical protein